jgi:hypothetical protein
MTTSPILSLTPPYHLRLSGTGAALRQKESLLLTLGQSEGRAYSNGQIDNYRGHKQLRFPNRPPLTLRIQARFSHPDGLLRGTAGFGFWNYPFVFGATELPRLPAAVWFFYASPPGNMALAHNVPGYGFKAAVIDATRPQALALIPLAPLAVPLLNIPPLAPLLWPPIQRVVGIGEAPIDVTMTDMHTYELRWGLTQSDFYVDGQPVLLGAPSPRGPLCLVIWLDNQYLIVTPQGRFGWGLLPFAERQWLEIASVELLNSVV